MEQANGSRKLIKWRSSLALANYITILGITFQILKQSLLFQIMFIIFRCVQVRNPQLCDFRGKREKVTQLYTNTIYGKTLIKRMSKISGRSFYQLWFNLKHPAFNLPFPLLTLLFLQWILKLTENFGTESLHKRRHLKGCFIWKVIKC